METLGMVAFLIFLLAVLVQLFYYLGIFSRLAFFKGNTQYANPEPVSVIICAKNEAFNLHKNLPLFFSQDYPEFQVVVVNDCSSDESEDILTEFEKRYPNLHVVNLKEDEINAHDKKLALTIGIKGAKHELLLLTDADCVPKSDQWIKSMVRNFTPETEIVLGYGGFEKRPGFVNKLIRFDCFFIALQYLSLSLAKRTYMGVGRNLAYRKSLFFKNKGFATHYHIRSGDDDLFINRVATKTNVKIEMEKESHTLSKPKQDMNTWFHQKRRHITTFSHYKTGDKAVLSLLSTANYVFYISLIFLLILNFQLPIVISLYIFRLLIQIFIFKKVMDKLEEKDLLLISPLAEVFSLFFYPSLVFGNMFIKENKWK